MTAAGVRAAWTGAWIAALLVPSGRAQCPLALETQKLTGSPSLANGNLGRSVDLAGDLLIAGAPGVIPGSPLLGIAYVFERQSGSWSQTARLKAPTTATHTFGWSVGCSGDTVLIGAHYADFVLTIEDLQGLAYDGLGGTLYGVDNDSDSLVVLDALTGRASVVGPLGFGDVRGLAFDPNAGTLFGTDAASDQLIAIDRATGAAAAVGALGFDNVQGLACDPQTGRLYGTDTVTDQLILVDAASGAGVALGALGFDAVRGLAFDPLAGTLYGSENATDVLLAIDIITGAGSVVGPLGFGTVRALAFDAGASALFGANADSHELLAIDALAGSGSPIGSLDTNAIDGGTAHVHRRNKGGPGNWGEVVRIVSSDIEAGDHFGCAVALERSSAVIGAYQADASGFDSGGAYVFERDQGGPESWGEVARLVPSDGDPADWFGFAVALSGDTLVVSARGDETTVGGLGVGSAYVFERDLGGPGAWGEAAKLAAPDGADFDQFGEAVAISGDTLAIGMPGDDDLGPASGSVFVFERASPGSEWKLTGKLTASDGGSGDFFGASLALEEDVLLVGAPWDDQPLANLGAAYYFERQGSGAWVELAKLTATGGQVSDQLGGAVGVSKGVAVAGARQRDEGGLQDVGACYVFELFPGGGRPSTSYCTAGTSASGCRATICAAGTPSASQPVGFDLLAQSVEGARSGIFFFGPQGRQALPWGNGTSFQCVVPPVSRGGLLKGNGTLFACDGALYQDLNAHWCPTCPKPNHNPGAGAVVQAQLWYRDPGSTSNKPTSLSDAVEFTVGP